MDSNFYPGLITKNRKASRAKSQISQKNVAASPPASDGLSPVRVIATGAQAHLLQKMLKHKQDKLPRGATVLGDVLVPWFEKTVRQPGEKLEAITEAWLAFVPAKLARHCRLNRLSRGTLTVATGSSTVKAELDSLLRRGLLRSLQMQSRGTVFQVKLVLDGSLLS